MRKKFIQFLLQNRRFGLSAVMLISLLYLLAPTANSQNIAASEPVQWVGMPNGFSTVPYGGDYRTFGYRKISTTVSNPSDGRGQWATTINVQNSGGDFAPANLAGGPGAGYLLISGPSSNRFQNKWNFNGIGQGAVGFINNVIKQGGGQDMGIDLSTTGRYTYVMRDAGYVNTEFYVGYTANAPVTVSRTGQSFNPSTFGSVISITTSATPSSGENVYVRYRVTNNDFTASTFVVQATGSGTSWSAEIPQQSCGATVYYYVYTSTRTLSQIGTDSESDRSLAALRYDDNFGSNFSYTVSPTPTAGITNNTGATELTCALTSISVTATGGVSYSWNNGLGSGATKSITAPGTYTVTVTGANGCTATSQIIITQNITTPTAGITNNSGATELTCALTSISVTATGGVSYAWDGGATPTTAANSFSAPGTYTVTVTGANGCTSTSQIIITQNITAPTAGITNNTGATELTCALTSISVTATGGVSYAWDGGATPTTAANSFSAPGTYTVTVTGANGCTATTQIIITQNITAPTAGITNNTGATELTCALTSISVTATGGVSYAWDGGATPTTAANSFSAPGTYTVTVTGANGCTATTQIIITQNITAPTAGITNNTGATELTCALTSISVTATGGVSYAWDGGATPTTAANSFSAPGTYTVTVTGANGCTATTQIIITQNITAPTAGITNNTGATELTCALTSISVTATGGVSYAWDGGATPTTAANSFSAPGTYTVTVTGANGCTTTAQIIITQNLNIPGTPAPVQGISNVCPYIGSPTLLTYSVPQDVNATSYLWIVPPTVTLVSGQGTNSIQVVINNGFIANANKVIKVRAQSSCGNSADRLFYLLAQLPTTPAPIVASTSNVCPSIGTNVAITYTIPKVAAATSYNWVAQAGTTTITHPNGLGVNDTTVTVTFSAGFTTSAITVSAVNDCNASGIRSLLIVRGNPATPGLVTGPTNACEFIAPGGSAATYSVANVAGNTYTWTAVPAAIGLTGQGTNSISFTYPSGFTTGSITVQATNGCGTSGVRTLAIAKLNPATPSVIDVIQTGFCPDRVYTYTLSGMPSNATSIQWTVPPAAIGGFTVLSPTSISVAYPATSVAGSVTATAVNNCGSSVARESLVKLAFCVFEFSGKGNNSTKETLASTLTDGLNVLVTPNPTTSNFKLQVNTNAKENIQVRVLDLQGRELKRMIAQPFQSIAIGNDLKAGTYIVETRQGQQVKTMRVIKF